MKYMIGIMVMMFVGVGCQGKNTAVTKDPVPVTTPQSNPKTVSKTQPKPTTLRAMLANPDVSCTTDEMCAISRMAVYDDGTCCHSCTPMAISKASFDQADALCRKSYGKSCPMKKCVGAKVSCQQGKCVLVQNP